MYCATCAKGSNNEWKASGTDFLHEVLHPTQEAAQKALQDAFKGKGDVLARFDAGGGGAGGGGSWKLGGSGDGGEGGESH